jgi:hypothetical protein
MHSGPRVVVAKTCSISRAVLSHSRGMGVAPYRSSVSGAQD